MTVLLILQNTESFVHHLDMQNTSSEFASLLINANVLPMPAVIMLLVASRGLIFWCFNVISIPIVLAYSRKILYGGKMPHDSGDERDFQYARSHAHGNNNNNNILEVINIFQSSNAMRFFVGFPNERSNIKNLSN